MFTLNLTNFRLSEYVLRWFKGTDLVFRSWTWRLEVNWLWNVEEMTINDAIKRKQPYVTIFEPRLGIKVKFKTWTSKNKVTRRPKRGQNMYVNGFLSISILILNMSLCSYGKNKWKVIWEKQNNLFLAHKRLLSS